ncbi:L-seryl-tRNA(Sec) selenium transferase [Desulfococcaceae bacterium OttesenSCG-928-F15]|nr:L-seryl-tRNA(Sec) selenium transferase [Desulfococcaceae bacterium OttesenSCG-928-F15]
MSNTSQNLLRALPGVDTLLAALESEALFEEAPRNLQVRIIRNILGESRQQILDGAITEVLQIHPEKLLFRVREKIRQAMKPNLARLVNATGVVVHTNLGRSLLAQAAIERILEVADHYSNLEYDLKSGARGLRYTAVSSLLTEITGAEEAMVVNNNAAAVLLCLDTLAKGKEAIVSRGELVEIGGAFRIPDVMARSGAILREVGTTNRTHLRDYEEAVNEKTGLLLKVHTSNFQILGFTSSVSMAELAALGRKHGIPVMDDLGSGTFVDFSRFGMAKEPTVQESLENGADLVTFSGDKLLGGPQAGIIVGKKVFIEKIRKNPLTRALRIDKLTLAALEGTLRLYLDPARAMEQIPTLHMLTLSENLCVRRAEKLKDLIGALGIPNLEMDIVKSTAKVGGGALPLHNLPSRAVAVRTGLHVAELEEKLRLHSPAVIGRVENDALLLDVRALQDGEEHMIAKAFFNIFLNFPKEAP